jgi:hypothetical protein
MKEDKNIKVQRFKIDNFNYPITNFIYEDSIYKFPLEVDSFRPKDTVQEFRKHALLKARKG